MSTSQDQTGKNKRSSWLSWMMPKVSFGGWKQAVSLVLLLAVAVIVNMHLIPAWALVVPAVALAMTTFGVWHGFNVSVVAAALLAPAFEPLAAPVSLALIFLYAFAAGWRHWNFVAGVCVAIGAAVVYAFAFIPAMVALLPPLHELSLYAWSFMPVGVAVVMMACCAYRYIRSPHKGENWRALTWAALIGIAWFVVLHLIFLGNGEQYVSNSQFALTIFIALAAALFSVVVLVRTMRLASKDGRNWFAAGVKIFGLALLWFAVPYTIFANKSERFVTLQMRYAMHPEYVSKVPYTVNDRVLPRATGELYVQNAAKINKCTTEKPHIQLKDGRMLWQSPLHDHRRFGQIFGAVPQVIRVDADNTEDHKENTDGSNFIAGNDSWVVKAAFAARHPLSQVAESAYYHKDDGSWVLLMSYVSKRPTWTGTMIPYLAGVMVVDQNLIISDYSVKHAAQEFPGATLYPPHLQREYAEAYAAWRGGFQATWANQDMIAEVSEKQNKDSDFNPQPYVIHMNDWGLQGVVALEPKGNHQYALVELLFFDAATGYVKSWVVPKDVDLNGPRRSADQVRSSNIQVDWSHRKTVEPRFVNGPRGMFWLCTIVTRETENENAYITSVLVDAKSLRPYQMQYAQQIRKFVDQERPASPQAR